MKGVVLLQNDTAADSLASSLYGYFHPIHVVHSPEELRQIIAKRHPHVAIVDMEIVSLSQVAGLRLGSAGVCVVCTHRLADEVMWTQALEAGAADLCPAQDTRCIVAAARRSALGTRRTHFAPPYSLALQPETRQAPITKREMP